MDILLVYPNPWANLDKDGEPCAVCPRDIDGDGGGATQYVGARLDRNRTKVLQDFAALNGGGPRGAELAKHELRSPLQSTKYTYMGIASNDPQLAAKLLEREPIALPRTKYYRDRIAEGALLPANAETAAAGRLRRFVPPLERLAPYLKAKEEPAIEATGEELPESPGMAALPESPDADGNLLTAPASDGEERVAVDAPSDGSLTELNGTEPAPEAAPIKSSKSKRQELP